MSHLFKRKWFVAVVLILVAGGIVRAALPTVVKRFVNRTLADLPGHRGHVEQIDIQLIRGAYQIRGLEVVNTSGKEPVPFIEARQIDFSVEWRQLLNGALVGEVSADGLAINLVARPGKKKELEEQEAKPWTDTVKELFPLRLNRVEIKDGSAHYRNFASSPPLNLPIDGINIVAENLTNSAGHSAELVSKLKGTARVLENGALDLTLDMNPLERQPTFNLDAKVEHVNLVQLNSLLRHHLGVDIEKGEMDMYLEVAAARGRFKGYVKPLVRNLNVIDSRREKMPLLTKIKEGIADVVFEIFENQPKETVATRLNFSGQFDDPNVDTITAVLVLLKNAFIESLKPSLDRSVNISDVK